MTDDNQPNPGRRRMLTVATTVAGGVAAGAAAVPFITSMWPSEAAKAAGAPVEADLSQLKPGEQMTVEWRGKPVWILYRTPEMLAAVKKDNDKVADPNSKNTNQQPAYAQNEFRSIKPEYLVLVGICTHLGCSPVDKLAAVPESFDATWQGGFYCPCHGSLFDLAGRVFKNKPAPDNLEVPKYKFLSATRLLIGESEKGA